MVAIKTLDDVPSGKHAIVRFNWLSYRGRVLRHVDRSSSLNAAVDLLARALMALIFLLSGGQKLAAPIATIEMIRAAGLPFAEAGYAIAVLVELGGGLLLLVGFKQRLSAVALATFCIVTAVAFHRPGDQMQTVQFLKNLAMTGGLLAFWRAGPGPWSIDSRAANNGKGAM